MKSLPFILLGILLVACNTSNSLTSTDEPEPEIELPTQALEPSNLPDLGKAPELTNEVWLNTLEPLRLADLRGQVVLLDMWTFG